MLGYLPKDDGVTHINIYSKGQTELGGLLSNFSRTPFVHPKYGELAPFFGLPSIRSFQVNASRKDVVTVPGI